MVANVLEHDGGAHVGDLRALGERVEDEVLQRLRGRHRDVDERVLRLERALSRGIVPAVYTEELFATGNDVDNRAAVAAVARPDLNLVGVALRGPRRDVDRITKGLPLHR